MRGSQKDRNDFSLFLIAPHLTPFSPLQAAASWGTPGAAAELLSEDGSDDEEIEEQWLGRVGSTGENVTVTCTACSELALSFVQALTSYNLCNCNCQPSARAAAQAWRQPPNAAQSSAMTRKRKTRLWKMMCRKRQKRCDLVMVFHGRLAMSASGVAYKSLPSQLPNPTRRNRRRDQTRFDINMDDIGTADVVDNGDSDDVCGRSF